MAVMGKLSGIQKANFTFASLSASVFPDLQNENNMVKGTVERSGDQ